MLKLASRARFHSGPQALGALPNLFQCRFKGSQLFRARIGKDFPNFGCVFAKNRRDQFLAFWSERYDPDAPILRALDPRSEERRVGKECRSRWSAYQQKKNEENVKRSARSIGAHT